MTLENVRDKLSKKNIYFVDKEEFRLPEHYTIENVKDDDFIYLKSKPLQNNVIPPSLKLNNQKLDDKKEKNLSNYDSIEGNANIEKINITSNIFNIPKTDQEKLLFITNIINYTNLDKAIIMSGKDPIKSVHKFIKLKSDVIPNYNICNEKVLETIITYSKITTSRVRYNFNKFDANLSLPYVAFSAAYHNELLDEKLKNSNEYSITIKEMNKMMDIELFNPLSIRNKFEPTNEFIQDIENALLKNSTNEKKNFG